MAERRPWLPLLAAVCLVACGEAPQLPPPGAHDGVLHLWRAGSQHPSEVRCLRIVQDGPDPERLRLHGVTLAAPMRDGVLQLSAPHGRYHALADDPVRLAGPILLSGVGAGGPLVGRARQASLESQGDQLVLRELELVQDGQLLIFDEARMHEVWSAEALAGSGQRLRSEPAPPLLAGAVAALTTP